MQLVAVSTDLVALGVALRAAVAGGGNLPDHPGQGNHRRQVRHRPGDKGMRQPCPFMGRTARTTNRSRILRRCAPSPEYGQSLQLRRQCTPAGLQFRHQFVQHHIPVIHNPPGCAIVCHDRCDLGLDASIIPEMAACHLRPHQKMREIHDTKRVLQEALMSVKAP